jgi:membrane protein YqaA with SNARE-associated domain
MTLATFLAALAGALLSSLVPVVNAELLLMGLALASPASAPLLVVVMAAGQMAGKSVLFLGGGRLSRSEALERRLARWRLDERSPRARAPLVGISAFTGLPPFYLVSVAAPALGVPYRTFLVVGLAGRLLRFAILVSLPQLLACVSRIGGP